MRVPAAWPSLVARALCLAAVASPLAAVPAEAGPTFPASTTLSETSTGGGQGPQVAVNADGSAIAAWALQPNGAFVSNVQGRANQPEKLQVAYRPTGGTFGTPITVSAPTASGFSPQVGIDAAGDAAVIWQERTGGGPATVRTISYTAGTGFGAASNLSDGVRDAETASLGVAPDGTAVAAWYYYDDSVSPSTGLVVERRRSGLGAFAPEVPLSFGSIGAADPSTALAAQGPVVAVNRHGAAAVAWSELTTNNVDGTNQVWLARAPAGSDFQAATTSSGPGSRISGLTELATEPEVVLAADGTATVAYEGKTSGRFEPRAILVPAGGSPAPFQTLGPSSVYAPETKLAIDGAGLVTAAWSYAASSSTPVAIEVATTFPGDTFNAATALDTNAGGIAEPAISGDSAGDVVVVWAGGGTPSQATTAFRGADSAVFDTPQTIAGPAPFAPAVGLGSRSIATVLYLGLSSGVYSIQESSIGAIQGGGAGGATPTPTPTPTPAAPTPTPAPAATPTPASAPTPTSAPAVAPVLTLGKVTLVGKAPKKGSKKAPAGPKLVSVSVTTTLHAAVSAVITKPAKGVVKGKSCVAPPKKKAKGAKPKSCTRAVAVGKPVAGVVDPGKATILTFGKKTPVGKFTLTLTGTGATGLPAKSVSTPLKVK